MALSYYLLRTTSLNSPSYRLYVDESGDPGLTGKAGASAWFVLGGLVVRRPDAPLLLGIADELLLRFGKQKSFEFHFESMSHDQRVVISQRLGAEPSVRALAVGIHKASLLNPDHFADGDRLYNYALRLLLERVSWLGRDAASPDSGDGTVECCLAYRGGLDQYAIGEYMRRLAKQSEQGQNQIDFRVIRPASPRVDLTRNLRGLQFADTIASAARRAVEPHRLGVIEPRYLRELSGCLYRHAQSRAVLGFGFLGFPPECLTLIPDELKTHWQ